MAKKRGKLEAVLKAKDSRYNLLLSLLKQPQIFFLLLALAIMGPLLLPGHILTLDSTLALNWDISGYFWGTSDGPESVFAATYNSAPIAMLLNLIGTLIPMDIVEKLFLVMLLWLCGMGGFNLPHLEGKARYYAGTLFTVNPFTYIRFVTGQWGVLGSYAIIPFAATSFIRLLEDPRPRHAVKTVLLLTLMGFLQIHGLILALLVLVVLYVVRVVVVPRTFMPSLPMLFLAIALFLGVNLFWMSRYAMAGGGSAINMPMRELQFFVASPQLNVISMRGFWLKEPFLEISKMTPFWWALFLPILILAIFGAVRATKRPETRWLCMALILLGTLSLLFALGPGGVPAIKGAFQELWNQVMAFRAFRDSHKFVAVLTLAYAYLGALGIQSLPELFKRPSNEIPYAAKFLGNIALIIPLFYTLPMFGTWGQLKPTEFPPDWQQVSTILNKDKDDYNLLVLPWHMYMDFPWLPNRWKRLANPAPTFFSQPTISGDNIEIEVAYSESSNPVSRYVERLLDNRKDIQNFGRLISPLNAKYVVLFKSADYNLYDFLHKQSDLELVLDQANILLFRNKNPTARAYVARDSVETDSFSSYLQIAAAQDPLEHLYLLPPNHLEGADKLRSTNTDSTKPQVKKISPISYAVDVPSPGYLVLTTPQQTTRDGWEYQGKSGTLNLGMMPAFKVEQSKGTITLQRFYFLYLPMYALAAASILAGAYVYWRWR